MLTPSPWEGAILHAFSLKTNFSGVIDIYPGICYNKNIPHSMTAG